ncbi:VOC family protein [Arthrobacter sp. ISL-28]|uniref:VOC family protein n=1 Tax=Arthrobacter sp. ISL-28 TaxID=2819108 RepID=UPI001BE8E82D|nr:VOC family protein [Arthrobacter sp. ISL-28]MBT2523368.1 VOC family protein [Arthrobacter sp. ISL-28]
MSAHGRKSSRIDHIAFLVREENFESATSKLARVLDLKFEGPYELTDLGTRVVIDWDAGIEFITVTDPLIATAQAAFLDEHGEGFYRLVVGVDDLDSALRRAGDEGLGLIFRYDGLTIDESWKERFDRIDEAVIESPSPGVRIALGQIEPARLQN